MNINVLVAGFFMTAAAYYGYTGEKVYAAPFMLIGSVWVVAYQLDRVVIALKKRG